MNAILLPHGFSSLSNEVLLKFILYGDKQLTTDSNKKLLEASLKFNQARSETRATRANIFIAKTLSNSIISTFLGHRKHKNLFLFGWCNLHNAGCIMQVAGCIMQVIIYGHRLCGRDNGPHPPRR